MTAPAKAASTVCRMMLLLLPLTTLGAETVSTFDYRQLSTEFFCEGAGFGDVDGDGDSDIVSGPYWYEGPAFERTHAIFEPAPFDPGGYSNNFFAFVHDLSGDGANDVLVIGFPGQEARWYENPGPGSLDGTWQVYEVLRPVENESPTFADLTGDGRPEIICSQGGVLGYAEPDEQDPRQPWQFRGVSAAGATGGHFTHGLGIGDVDGDGRLDLLARNGWWRHPDDPSALPWEHHPVAFGDRGGSQMYVRDLDGDGDADVVSSLDAHGHGLAWFEQRDGEAGVEWERHLIMGSAPGDSLHGVRFSGTHAIAMADLDGDGIDDLVTGKRYWAHGGKDPGGAEPPVLTWFRIVPGGESGVVDFLPRQIHADSGVGTQVEVGDANGDGLPDVLVGNKKGTHLSLQRRPAGVAIFDGSTLDGWEGDPRWWRVEDGAITGESTVANPLPANTFLFWRGGELADFDLRLEYRIGGSPDANSGIQFRCQESPEFRAAGYQADLDGSGKWLGTIYDEHGRGQLVGRGLRVVIDESGGRTQAPLRHPEEGSPPTAGWNTYRILAIDTHVTVWVNGERTAELIDRQAGARDAAGKLAFQIHSMAPCKVQFRNVVLRDLGHTVRAGAPPRPARDGIRPTDDGGRALNLGFEDGTLRDWTAEGDAFAGQPIEGDTVTPRRGDMASQHAGSYWIGGFERAGDGSTGTLTSAPFRVTAPWASFLVAGGPHAVTCVEILDAASGEVLFRQSGKESEALEPYAVDLSALQGQHIQLRLVDRHTGHWGHVNYDDFLFHAERPQGALPLQEPASGGRTPEQAVLSMQLPDGFRARLLAAEPELKQPIAFTFDERGRVWVVEALTYPRRAPDGEGRDRILIFEDTSGDGRLDSRKVFTEGLNLVSGIEVGFGGVWVGAAPYLLFIPDADHDDHPDGEPQVLLDGWGYQDTHETLNAFRWGPDGWLYGCHGVFTHSRVGKPGAADADRVPLNAGIWRYHPTRHEFEVFAWGTSNPWGVDFDDRGQAFATACVIPHLFHLAQGGRYTRQAGRHFGEHVYADIETIADHRHYIGATPHAGNGKSDAVGGGHAHCGLAVYLADQFPPAYRGHLFFHNIHGHRINSDIVERIGRTSGFVGRHGRDLMVSGDPWHLGTAIRVGPDGGLTFTDWYDQQSCHNANPEIWDRGNGRLYSISFGAPRLQKVDLRANSDAELVELQLHAGDWYVRTARRLLQERAARGELDTAMVARELRAILAGTADPTRRLRALWCLHAVGALSDGDLAALYADPDEYVAAWAIQLAGEDGEVDAALLVTLAPTAGAVVRLYLASVLQRLPVEDRWELAAALLAREDSSADPNLPLLMWYGVEPLVGADPQPAMQLAARCQTPLVKRFLVRAAASDAAGLAAAVELLGTTDAPKLVIPEILRALKENPQLPAPPSWEHARDRLQAGADSELRDAIQALGSAFGDRSTFPQLRETLADPSAPIAARERALDVLRDARDPELPAVLQGLLREDGIAGQPLKQQALRVLADTPHPDTARAILDAFPGLRLLERSAATATLAARKDTALAMLEALRAGTLARGDLSAAVIRQLQHLGNPAIDEAIGELWGASRGATPDVAAEAVRIKALLSAQSATPADVPHGRQVFDRVCGVCHTLFGSGAKIGPDLTGSLARTNLDFLLENVLDPSAVLGMDYALVIVMMKDERVVSGIVAAETAGTLTMRQATGEEVVLRQDEIANRIVSPVSMMPPGLLSTLEPAEIRDLVAYLASPTQAPARAEVPALDASTGRIPGALEGESLQVLSSTGEARPQDMSPFTAARWSGGSQLWWTGGKPGDRLVLEFAVTEEGERDVIAAFTKARDYGVVRVWVDDDDAHATTIDLYSPDAVLSTGALSLGRRPLAAGTHRLTAEVTGANPSAIPAHMFGLDYLLVR